jgi:hypothetical protein
MVQGINKTLAKKYRIIFMTEDRRKVIFILLFLVRFICAQRLLKIYAKSVVYILTTFQAFIGISRGLTGRNILLVLFTEASEDANTSTGWWCGFAK